MFITAIGNLGYFYVWIQNHKIYDCILKNHTRK